VVIEVGVVTGYVIAWAVRKARRAGGRLDSETDAVIDAGLDRLHEVVVARLAHHPAMAELVEEAEQAALSDGKVSDLTCQQVEAALAVAAHQDKSFEMRLAELTAWLIEAERAKEQVMSRPGAAVFTGDSHARADRGGIAFGQVAGHVHIARETGIPSRPGRFGH
jgi:uncharacterized protein YgbK (DUF1537 family)